MRRPSRFRRFLQIGTFLRKEAVDVLRQPRLLLTLVIGPFLIMALFGLGYRNEPAKLRTLFVAPEGSPLIDKVEGYAEQIDQFVKYEGVTTDAAAARARLLDDDVDLLVSFPDAPLDSVLDGERAQVTVIHSRLDPIEQTAINFASQLGIAEINGQILASVVEGGQSLTTPAGEDVFGGVSSAIDGLSAAATSGDEASRVEAIDVLDEVTARLAFTVRASSALTEQLLGDQVTTPDLLREIRTLQAQLEELRADPSTENIESRVDGVRGVVSDLQGDFERFTSVDPGVLVRPFESDVRLAVPGVHKVTDWYAPAAVVLMLQQFGVAFGALSFVRERRLGIVDVYRVAPVNATATLIGKYLAYMFIGCAIGAALTGLVVGFLDVPVAASVAEIALVMALSLFASIGVGFVISLASASDAQAVQYTMILLLASLFFSGFFLSVNQLRDQAKWLSFLLPVSYGMRLLRDVMLRGAPIDQKVFGGLIVYGIVMFALAWLGTRRRMSIART
jgi:ABC-2 type transport system permease protein